MLVTRCSLAQGSARIGYAARGWMPSAEAIRRRIDGACRAAQVAAWIRA